MYVFTSYSFYVLSESCNVQYCGLPFFLQLTPSSSLSLSYHFSPIPPSFLFDVSLPFLLPLLLPLTLQEASMRRCVELAKEVWQLKSSLESSHDQQ